MEAQIFFTLLHLGRRESGLKFRHWSQQWHHRHHHHHQLDGGGVARGGVRAKGKSKIGNR